MTDNNQKNEVSETGDAGTENAMPQKKSNPAGRILFLVITAMCFVYLYYRLNGAASREGLPLITYMTDVFSNVAWVPWLGLMIAYSLFYFLVDTLVVTRALNWFLAAVSYTHLTLPTKRIV